MITKNFKNLLASFLAASGGATNGYLPVKGVNGTTYYVAAYLNDGFPRAVTAGFTNTAANAGISVGRGTTAATEDDYQLESPITSGLSGTLNRTIALDENGNQFVRYDLILTNSTNSDITVGEIGYKQQIRATTAQGATTSNNLYVCLIDRTVLTTPVTIAAGDYAVIRYTLKTVINVGE